MIEIKEVNTKKEIKNFIEFPLKLYKGNPYFVPPLYMDEKKLFTKNYVYYDQSEAVYFNAYQDGKQVGRISGILQKASNEKWNQKRVRFTRFDCIDNQEVANALFNKVEAWAKMKGMDEVVGPLGFSDLEREGLLVDGFDQLSTFEEQYNYPYYEKLITNCGYQCEVNWTERKLSAPKTVDDRLQKLTEKVFERYKLHVGKSRNTNDFIKRYSQQIFEVLDTTYVDIYGTVPFTDGMKKLMIDNFRLIVNVKYVTVILDENDKVVAFGVCFPSIAKALQKSGGRLTLPTVIRLLHDIRHPKVIDLGLIGVLPEWQKKGLNGFMLSGIMKMFVDNNVQYAETNLNLEDNVNVQNQWKAFDNVIHKRRRSYKKNI